MNPDLYQPTEPSGAVISSDELYRYVLWRTWDVELPRVAYCMLNPSTADASIDDATIRRCIRFARDQGFGGIDVINLFALRSTKPEHLLEAIDPDGPENRRWWKDVLAGSELMCAAWGAWWENLPDRKRPARGTPAGVARQLGVPVVALAFTASGTPRHPLYLKTTCRFEPYDGH